MGMLLEWRHCSVPARGPWAKAVLWAECLNLHGLINQGTTLGQAVKGRDSISLPGMQLDPVGTQAVPGTRGVRQPGGLLGQRGCMDVCHGGRNPWDKMGTPRVSRAAPWGRPAAGTMSLCHALLSPVSRAPAPASGPAVTSRLSVSETSSCPSPKASLMGSLLYCGQGRDKKMLIVSLGMTHPFAGLCFQLLEELEVPGQH